MSLTLRKRFSAILTYLVLSVIFVFVIFPIFYTFMGSFKSNQELLTSGSTIIPHQFVLDNYKRAWSLPTSSSIPGTACICPFSS